MKLYKTSRKLLKPLIYIAVFWIVMDLIPGVVYRAGSTSKILAATGFYMVFNLGTFLLSFFKLQVNYIARFIVSSITVGGYLFVLDKYLPDLLDLNPTYVGDIDLLFTRIPRLANITDIYLIALFCAIFLVICCIIIEVSIKRN